MSRYVAITFLVLVVMQGIVIAPPPVRLTIDCRKQDGQPLLIGRPILKSRSLDYLGETFDVESFCDLIHTALPKAVKDGKFVLLEPRADQDTFADTQVPVIVAAPRGLPNLRKLKFPKLRIPNLNVPRLSQTCAGPAAPVVGKSVVSVRYDEPSEEESSAEKMEKFKKGVQKMLHVVKVIGQIDKYLTERTRIIVDKLSKTFAE